jgi:4-amino-4-deoxy-L-arabinose transferase-like glycosyltransferase
VRFGRWLSVIAAAGLVLRLVYALVVLHGVPVAGDGLEFHALAVQLADGHGYVEPLFLAPGHIPTADKPPLYPLVLAGPAALGAGSVAWNRIVSSLLGTVLIVAVGVLGRRVGGPRAGLAAAGVAAVYPAFIALDGSVRGESLYAPLIAFALLAAYRLRERPDARRAAELGAIVGLAALTRSEAVLLLMLGGFAPLRGRVRAVGIAVLACAVVLSPWLVRNWVRLGSPVLSTNVGGLVFGANCQAAFHGPLIGAWACYPPLRASRRLNEVDLASRLTRTGLRYARRHGGRVPAVMGVRLLRTYDLWSPRRAAALEALIDDADRNVERAAFLGFYVVAALAVAGAVLLRRAGEPLAILLVPVLIVCLISVLGYGTSRFRVPADVSLVVLAGVAASGRRRAVRP